MYVSDCIKGIFLSNQPGQPRPTLININSNKPLYCQLGGCSNTIDDPYALSEKAKNMDVTEFNSN